VATQWRRTVFAEDLGDRATQTADDGMLFGCDDRAGFRRRLNDDLRI
jgi:hypothetical protein